MEDPSSAAAAAAMSFDFLEDDSVMYGDNFSIDIADIWSILNENQDDPPVQPPPLFPPPQVTTADGFQHGEIALGQMDPEQRPHTAPGLEDSLPLDSQQEMPFNFFNEFEKNSIDITDNGGTQSLPHFDSSNYCPITSHYSNNGEELSFQNNNYIINSFGDCPGSYLTGNLNPTILHTNMQNCGIHCESLKGADLIPFSDASDNGFYVKNEDNEYHEYKTSFQIGLEEARPNACSIDSVNNWQAVQTGASHYSWVENFNFSRQMMHTNFTSCAFADSKMENGNVFSSSTCSYRYPDAMVSDILKSDINNIEIFSDQLEQDFPFNSENLDRKENHLFPPQGSSWTNELKLGREDESPDSSLADVSITDLEPFLPEELSTKYNDSDDMSMISESSTESSPLPSSRNSDSDHDDKTVVDSSELAVFNSDSACPSKVKAPSEDESTQLSTAKDGSSANQINSESNNTSIVDDDPDICILDDISDPACPPRALQCAKRHIISQRPNCNHSRYHGMVGCLGLRSQDERLTFRLALQDFSQPKSETSPPDGVLAVPLLRHQRIALSWMVHKETVSLHCSGGILADDQGLGKTVSTLALILTERSPSTKPFIKKEDKKLDASHLDDGDDNVDANMMMKKPRNMTNKQPVVKGRPAAGTLVVCPTSVLRQWAEELKTKVTSTANLSYLVYHGCNRTKDPNELANYDVVLTTYAIVSMEVPKQPLVDKEDEEEKGKQSSLLLKNKKRKDPPTSNNNKNRKMDESAANRPLGRVAWFRVILDEAQSIKNYRTQAARACWGLRAKRRWCLSGTPIQNSVDDLYSYFRFLRYDPYAVYKSFCSTIKIPVARHPTRGYKKLQAVLKTIMLRRTKGTILDGKPIISLPPKTISLKKVEFSLEERSFYSTLEVRSREQFMEYEDAGTVKQNYVNILLMLLRLRQACDHPLLVKGCDSNSSQRSSVEMAKKLPREKRILLLSCLEVSLAICTICNDPPEDAVISICGHVFCNQCICQHLTADENICPLPTCKVQLRAASIFSKNTLKCSLSDELVNDCSSSGGSCSELGDKHGIFEYDWSFGSSKIKTALEILRSMPKIQCSPKFNANNADAESRESSVNRSGSAMASSDSEQASSQSFSEKAIIFSQWTGMLDLLEGPLKSASIQYRRLDGTMSVNAREKAINDFKTLPEVTVIIMSLKAASLGLNLVAANHVILLDLWWNPTTEDQAIDRAHRIGQTRPVTVSRLTIKDTVEDKILSLQEKKRVMAASAFGEDESGSRQSRLTVEDLRYLFTA